MSLLIEKEDKEGEFMKFINTIFVITICLMLTSCNVNQIEIQSKTSFDDSIPNYEISNLEEQPEPFAYDLKSWVGVYEFYEFIETQIGSNMGRVYEIKIHEENGVYYADVILNGFQVYLNARALVQGDSESIDLVLYSYFPDTISEPFDEGETLLTFAKIDGDMITKWGIIPPLIVANEEPGIYFKRIS